MPSWIVICPDGVIRHDGRFDDRADAERFMWWGHPCGGAGGHMPAHRITDDADPPGARPPTTINV